MENHKHGPCLDKNCSFCCDPVKINQKAVATGFKPPEDRNGNPIWKPTGEILAPDEKIDTDRVVTYECINFDKVTGKCLDYDNRPHICRDTTCIQDESRPIDEQHKRVTEVKFIKLK